MHIRHHLVKLYYNITLENLSSRIDMQSTSSLTLTCDLLTSGSLHADGLPLTIFPPSWVLWPVCGVTVERSKRSRFWISAGPLTDDSLGQATYTHVPLSRLNFTGPFSAMHPRDILARMSRGCYEDAKRKTASWNLGFTKQYYLVPVVMLFG